MDWQQTILGPPQTVVFQGLIRTLPELRDMAAIERGMVRIREIYALLDHQLSRHGYLAGPDFTLADIPTAIQTHRWFSFDFERPSFPHLRAWYDRLLERPAFRTHCAKPLT
jgi:glutathione S-transferase